MTGQFQVHPQRLNFEMHLSNLLIELVGILVLQRTSTEMQIGDLTLQPLALKVCASDQESSGKVFGLPNRVETVATTLVANKSWSARGIAGRIMLVACESRLRYDIRHVCHQKRSIRRAFQGMGSLKS